MITIDILLELGPTLRSAYKLFQKDKSQIALLKKSIESFETTVSDFSKVKRLLASVAVVDLPTYLDPLLLAAKSYAALALENTEELATHHRLLDQAIACYRASHDIIKPVAPNSMTPTLSNIELDVVFCPLKMEYFKAAGELASIKNQLGSEQADSDLRAQLQKVQTTISAFYKTLTKEYKNQYYRKILDITAEFETEVKEALNEADSLLKTASKRKQTETTPLLSTDEGLFKKRDSIPKKRRPNQPATTPQVEVANILVSLSFLVQAPKQEDANTANKPQLS
ncbi:hypothetical protein Lery_0218 [Legionella erythra]|uniref:Uncharacterized protein n=2 Tax=Legionella erythra TaxID=448 RepID=A0A0W0TV37_LEGER|nr:hypothetical protein Lery_0218 [Legionella erythra]